MAGQGVHLARHRQDPAEAARVGRPVNLEQVQMDALIKALSAEREARERAERQLRLADEQCEELRQHVAELQGMVFRAYAEGFR